MCVCVRVLMMMLVYGVVYIFGILVEMARECLHKSIDENAQFIVRDRLPENTYGCCVNQKMLKVKS